MIHLLLLPLLLLLGPAHGYLQQLHSQFPASPDPRNRIVCQNFTDFLPQVVFMYAADDFVVPQPDLTLQYSAMQLTLGLLRMKHDQDPQALTVQLLRNNDTDDSPGLPFFQYTFRALNWSDWQLDVPFNLTLLLRFGLLNELDHRTRFDPLDSRVMPRDVRTWLAVYATGPRNYALSMQENCLFWSTAAAGVRNSTLPGALVNRPYFFRDVGNALKEGFTQWTPAPVVERAFLMESVSHNLAWSLALVARDTAAPTGAPTNATPTRAPTGAPSGAPTEDDEGIVWPNVTAPTVAGNGTIVVLSDSPVVRVVVSIIVALVTSCCLCCLCVYYCVKRRKIQKLKQEKVQLQRLDSHYNNEKDADGGGGGPLASFDGNGGAISPLYSVSLERTNESTSTTYEAIEAADDVSFVDVADHSVVTMRNNRK
jgi:hypothetical protein